ncbi:hypothetical protein K435DRAFT_810994 [Dendrothele bispora CBS 962.96]|uniref:Uncharacterized protein n=1 Tax=Dendrothele bispora (strain CBS 962.96) TaxID=1314807 RepID=A0A4S8KUG6_DENBC|nr:hypothetical protein K435DRAFT_810994 [Dendrothele bispora CBS 962.96]
MKVVLVRLTVMEVCGENFRFPSNFARIKNQNKPRPSRLRSGTKVQAWSSGWVAGGTPPSYQNGPSHLKIQSVGRHAHVTAFYTLNSRVAECLDWERTIVTDFQNLIETIYNTKDDFAAKNPIG